MDHIVRSIENIKSMVESMDDVMEDTVQQFHDNFINDVLDRPYYQDSDIFTYPTLFTTEPSVVRVGPTKYRRKYPYCHVLCQKFIIYFIHLKSERT